MAGYLYALNFILDKFPETQCRSSIVSTINLVVQELIARGNQKGVLYFQWKGKKYIGAAHGTIGIVNILLQSRPYLSVSIDELLISTIDYLLSIRLPSGNFPSSEGKHEDRLVHFCHGMTGGVLMLCNAYRCFEDERFLQAALDGGALIWERGLILKGKGLCHGISGNCLLYTSPSPRDS